MSGDDVPRRYLARLWVASEERDEHHRRTPAARAALSDLRRVVPLYRREWASLPIDDRARARVEEAARAIAGAIEGAQAGQS